MRLTVLAFAALLSVVTPALAQNSVRQREPDAVERALESWAQRAHEKQLQREQHQHERRLTAGTRSLEQIVAVLNAPTSYTRNQANGRAWAGLDQFLREFFVNAVHDAAMATGEGPSFTCTCSVQDMVAGVTSFYDETGRLAVPIARVVRLVAQRRSGAPDITAQVRATITEFSEWSDR